MSAMHPTAAFNNSVGPDVRERRRAHSGLFAAAFVLVVVAGAQTATQLCARDFAYEPVLGANARGFRVGTGSIATLQTICRAVASISERLAKPRERRGTEPGRSTAT
jgi:hypothetical protein